MKYAFIILSLLFFNNLLLSRKANWNKKLIEAAKEGDFKNVKVALKNKANIQSKDKRGNTALHYASSGIKNTPVPICGLIKSFKDVVFSAECMPVITSLGENNGKIVKLLLSKGANTQAKNNDGQVPLHMIYLFPKLSPLDLCNEIVNLLMNSGTNINIKDNAGKTPLHLAIEYDNEEIAQICLNKGVNVSSRDNMGRTPLHYAYSIKCKYSQEKCISMLLNRGADRSAKDNKGYRALPIGYNWRLFQSLGKSSQS